MSIQETVRKLNEMKLFGMAESYVQRHTRTDHNDLSFDDYLTLIVDDEYRARGNKKQEKLLKKAKLKISAACFEDINYNHPRGLMKTRMLNLQNSDWITHHQNILITGSTGVGKSYLACAFGNLACRLGYSTAYFRWPRFLGDMLAAKGEGAYLNYLAKLAKVKVLIIDDFGLTALTAHERKDFMELIEDRHMAAPTIITSQLPLAEWHSQINDATMADAICDRLFHLAHRIELSGNSMRKRSKTMD